MKSVTTFVLCFSIFINLTACGTILHPERKGQVGGRLDPGVVILDAIGLFVFFIPGVIAFAVDFSNGTIYLPGGKHAALTEAEVNLLSQNGQLNKEVVEVILNKHLETPVSLSNENIQLKEVRSTTDLQALLNGYHNIHYAAL